MDTDGHVSLYDSMSGGVTSKELDTQLALLYGGSGDLDVTIAPVQQQLRGSDCGLFAIAFCLALVSNQNPVTVRFRQSTMRSHLSEIFRTEIIKPFPTIHGKQQQKIGTCSTDSVKIALWCVCRLPSYAFNHMVECSRCERWYHKPCVGIPDTKKSVTVFNCHSCKTRN